MKQKNTLFGLYFSIFFPISIVIHPVYQECLGVNNEVDTLNKTYTIYLKWEMYDGGKNIFVIHCYIIMNLHVTQQDHDGLFY